MNPHIFAIYFWWHYGPGLKGLIQVWKNFLLFGWHYFSVGLLLSTLFSPWHRISSSRGRGFDIGRWSRAFSEDLIARILGAIVRSIVIILGLFFESIVLAVGAGLVFIWLTMPGLVPLAIFTSLLLVFS